jgi:hypothetical protein
VIVGRVVAIEHPERARPPTVAGVSRVPAGVAFAKAKARLFSSLALRVQIPIRSMADLM